MSLTKAMQYEEVPMHINMKMAAKKEDERALSKIKTSSILWHLIMRYKIELLMASTILEFAYIVWLKVS